jgi:CBS domain-containing protein
VSGAQRVFVARLSGLPVFDPNGDQVGKVRDVVVALRLGNQPPRVLGLVVEVFGRRRIFVPMTRVTSVEVGHVVTTGLVNMRRFEQRPNEIRVLGELLDRTLTIRESGKTAAVYDAAIEQVRTRDWVLSKVAVIEGTKRFRRRGHRQVLDWSDAEGLTEAEERQGATHILAAFGAMKSADLAGVLHDFAPKRRHEIAAALDDGRLADVLEELPEEDQVGILEEIGTRRAAAVLAEMAPDDAADLVAELPAELAESLLTLMEPDEAEDVRRLLSYADHTAGGLMTSEPVILPPDATVADALARVRNAELSPALAAMVYVCRPPLETPTGKLVGVAHIQRLLREAPSALVSGVIDADVDGLRPDAGLQAVHRYLATYNLVAAPVVDEDHRLLGAVTVDDVLDHLLPQDWRDHNEPEVTVGGA